MERVVSHELGVSVRVDEEPSVLRAANLVRRAWWTPDAPFRETRAAIEPAAASVPVVEMRAVSLDFDADADADRREVVGVARVTTMAVGGDDIEHGDADGTHRILAGTGAIGGPLRLARHDIGRR